MKRKGLMATFIIVTFSMLAASAEDEGAPKKDAGGASRNEKRSEVTESKAIDYAAMSEDIEIMRRIIEKSLREKFPGLIGSGLYNIIAPPVKALGKRLEATQLVTSTISGLANAHCRGVYLPGYGALFMLDLNLKAKEKTTPEEKEEEPETLWEKTEREVKGQASRGAIGFLVNDYWNSKALSRAKGRRLQASWSDIAEVRDHLIELIAENAPNIEQLAPSDSVTIVIFPRHGPRDFSQVLTRDSLLESFTFLKSSGGPTPSVAEHPAKTGKVLIMRARKSDLTAYKKKEIDLKTFKERVELLNSVASGYLGFRTQAPQTTKIVTRSTIKKTMPPFEAETLNIDQPEK